MEANENIEEIKDEFSTVLTKTNIEGIEKDAERLRIFRQNSKCESGDVHFNEDVDDLANYTHEEDGVKVLDDTTTINRKAIFHDLNRLKNWRLSVDKERQLDPGSEKSDESEKQFETINENNIDEILNQLPDIVKDLKVTKSEDVKKPPEEGTEEK